MQFSTIKKTEDLLKLEKHSLNEEREAIENMNYHAGRRTMLGSALAQVNKEVRAPFLHARVMHVLLAKCTTFLSSICWVWFGKKRIYPTYLSINCQMIIRA